MKIISLSPSITEVLFAIGVGDQIVGNTYLCDYPEEAKKITRVGSWTDINFDKVKELDPTVIFTSTVVQERLADNLRKQGFVVYHFDPRSLQNIYDDISKIGSLLKKEKKAQDVIKKMQNQAQVLTTNSKRQPIVYVEEWYQPPMVSGNWVPDIIRLVGGAYPWSKPGDISREISDDEVIQQNPDVILVAYCGFGKNSDISKVLNRTKWNNIKAIKNKKVFAIDENQLNRPGPRVLDVGDAIKELIQEI